jgi:hypothetical protein
VGPAAAGAATVGRAASPATAKREAWKAAFRARRAAAAGTAVIASAAAAAVQEGVSRAPAAAAAGRIGSSGDGLPEMIPLPLLLGECKYTNPQVRQGAWSRGTAVCDSLRAPRGCTGWPNRSHASQPVDPAACRVGVRTRPWGGRVCHWGYVWAPLLWEAQDDLGLDYLQGTYIDALS